jgi:hypothetical protein
MLPSKDFLQKIFKYYPYALLVIFLFVGAYLRLHNAIDYTTYWADDGGGHIKYMETIYYEHRLPSFTETYLAWHEPLYYVLLFPWQKIGLLLGVFGLHWAAALNILIYGLFLFLVWKLSRLFSQSALVSAVSVSLFSVLFIGVKLSAYINNELLTQTYILWLIYLFIKSDLLAENKLKKVIIWSLLLAIGLWIKLTVYLVLLAVIFFYSLNIFKKKYLWKYVLIIIVIPVTLNIPWLLYKKNNFNSYFTINIYDAKPRQNIVTSDAWKYIFTINKRIFTDYPYWYKLPYSYFSILLSDSFGDYYNLFNNKIEMDELPKADKILIVNGRYTTPAYWQSLLNTNRIGLSFFLVWLIGFIVFIFSFLKKRIDFSNYLVFWLIALFGGWAALLYNNLLLPYLDVGVLKGHFIYYTYPLFVILAYFGLEKIIKNKIMLGIIFWLPLVMYVVLGWRILRV